MRTKDVALTLYLASCVLAIAAAILGSELLMLFSKPVVIPAILFYYLSVNTPPVRKEVLWLLFFSFIGDTIVLLGIEDQTKIIMIPFFVSYLLLLRLAIEDLRKMKLRRFGLLLSGFIFSFLMYLMYALIQLFIDTNPELVLPVIIYGVLLAALAAVAGYGYYAENSVASFYLAIAALMSVVSDVFYIIYTLIFHIEGFSYFEFSAQLFSYYFIVRYCISKSRA